MKKNVNNILYAANYYHDVALKKLANPAGIAATIAINIAIMAAYGLAVGALNKWTRSFNLKDSLVELRSDYENYMTDYKNDKVIVENRKYFDMLIVACTDLQELLIKLSKLSTEEQKDPKSLALIEQIIECSYKIPPLCSTVRTTIEQNRNWGGLAIHFLENAGVPAITNSDQLMASLADVATYVDSDRLKYESILNDVKKQVVAQLPHVDTSNLADKPDKSANSNSNTGDADAIADLRF